MSGLLVWNSSLNLTNPPFVNTKNIRARAGTEKGELFFSSVLNQNPVRLNELNITHVHRWTHYGSAKDHDLVSALVEVLCAGG